MAKSKYTPDDLLTAAEMSARICPSCGDLKDESQINNAHPKKWCFECLEKASNAKPDKKTY